MNERNRLGYITYIILSTFRDVKMENGESAGMVEM